MSDICKEYFELDRQIKELSKRKDALSAQIKKEFSGSVKTGKSNKIFTCDEGVLSLRKSERNSWDNKKLVAIVKENNIPCKIHIEETVDVKELTELCVDGECDPTLLEPAMKVQEVLSLVVTASKGASDE